MTWAHVAAARGIAPDSTSQHVLQLLAEYAGDDGQAWPSVATLARDSLLHRATVQRALRALQSAGVITLVRESVGQLPACYLLHLTGRAVLPAAQCDPPQSATGTRRAVQQRGRRVLPVPAAQRGPISRESHDPKIPERVRARDDAPPAPVPDARDHPVQAAVRRWEAEHGKGNGHGKDSAGNGALPEATPNSKNAPQSEASRLLEIERRRREAAAIVERLAAEASAKG